MNDTEKQSLYEYIRSAIEPSLGSGDLPDISLPPDPNSPIPFADGNEGAYGEGCSDRRERRF